MKQQQLFFLGDKKIAKKAKNKRYLRLYKDKEYLSSDNNGIAEQKLLRKVIMFAIAQALHKPRLYKGKETILKSAKEAREFLSKSKNSRSCFCQLYCSLMGLDHNILTDFVEKATSGTKEGNMLREGFFKIWKFSHDDKKSKRKPQQLTFNLKQKE